MPRRLNAILVLALVLGACTSPEPTVDDDDGMTIVVTTSVLGDIVSRLVGDAGTVDVLMGPGDDPHDFSLSARQTARLLSADLVVANGLGLEEGMIPVLESAASSGVNIIELAPNVDPIAFGTGETDSLDPHFWLDPIRMASAVDLIASNLDSVDGAGPWEENSAALRADLEALDIEIRDGLANIPRDRRKLVTNHDALGYFAERYDFEIVATVIPAGNTLAEPSAADLSGLVELLRELKIRAIFAETSVPDNLARAAAAELGADVSVYQLYTGALGEPGSGADSYFGLMRTDADIIARALG